jgi:hypothetical protein
MVHLGSAEREEASLFYFLVLRLQVSALVPVHDGPE